MTSSISYLKQSFSNPYSNFLAGVARRLSFVKERQKYPKKHSKEHLQETLISDGGMCVPISDHYGAVWIPAPVPSVPSEIRRPNGQPAVDSRFPSTPHALQPIAVPPQKHQFLPRITYLEEEYALMPAAKESIIHDPLNTQKTAVSLIIPQENQRFHRIPIAFSLRDR